LIRLELANHTLSRRSLQLTSCWFNNSATTCLGSKILPVAP
jgi:hypothetical protein